MPRKIATLNERADRLEDEADREDEWAEMLRLLRRIDRKLTALAKAQAGG